VLKITHTVLLQTVEVMYENVLVCHLWWWILNYYGQRKSVPLNRLHESNRITNGQLPYVFMMICIHIK